MRKLTLFIMVVTLLLASATFVFAEAVDPDLSGKSIGLVNAGPDDYYYKLFDVYEALAKDMGWEVTVLNSEYSPEKEISNVQDLITKGVDAIAVITANVYSAGQAAKIANEAGVPIFFVVGRPDEESTGGRVDGHVGFSYYNCAYMNGEWIAKNYPNAKVVTIDGFYGQGTAEAHAQGLQDALDDYNTGIKAVSVGSGEWQRTKAIPVAQDLLASGREFDIVYVMNEEMTAGVLQVFEEQGIVPGKDKIILTTNGKEEGIEWIKAGKVAATAPDPPSLCAHLSFQQIVRYFKGESFERLLTVYSDLITKENVDAAIPWKKDAYFAGVETDKFEYDLAYYEAKMRERESK